MARNTHPYANSMTRLIDELRKLPGVGTRSAQRLAFHLLRAPASDAQALSDAILDLRATLRLCSICNNITDIDPCVYCASPTRDHGLLCVLEEPTNIATIEKTRSYNGVYHVLHGTLSPIGGVGPEQLRIANLLTRLAPTEPSAAESTDGTCHPGQSEGPAFSSLSVLAPPPVIREVILATSPTTEGEATAHYLAEEIRQLAPQVRVTRIATGIPAGSDIEYADEITMTRALENRRDL